MSSPMETFQHLKIPFDYLKKATNDFARVNYIAEGGFGAVFRGELLGSNGQIATAAVKRFFASANNSGDADFWREISLLSEYKHENIIKLLGFYYEPKERILVYDFARNGSLGHHLGNPNLTWIQRLKICLGAARGLEYLHNPRGGQNRVLHLDIKSANILLGNNWNAKIADFGFSKHGPANQKNTMLITEPKGTPSYVDPVYVHTSCYRKESDVYSFGVVILEVLCSRFCFDDKHYKQNDLRRSLTAFVTKCSSQQIIDKLIDVNLLQQMKKNSFDIVLALARQCLELDQTRRPSMDFIVRTFEREIQYQEGQSFWLNAMKTNEILAKEISERDEEALKYLKDIKWCRIHYHKGFKLEFFFDTNPFFKNSVLTKIYHMIDDDDPTLENVVGTEIEWLPGKCLTQKILKKKPQKGSKNAKP